MRDLHISIQEEEFMSLHILNPLEMPCPYLNGVNELVFNATTGCVSSWHPRRCLTPVDAEIAGVRQCRWQRQLLTSGRVCTGKSSMRLKGDCRGQCCQMSPAKSLLFRQGRGDGEEGGRLGRSPVHSGSDSRSTGMWPRGSGLHGCRRV